MEQTISVNMEYLIKSIEEKIKKDLIFRELHSLINGYCIEVTGKHKEHILFEEVQRMFPNIEIIDITIAYAYKCIEGITDTEKDFMYKIIHRLLDLKNIYQDQVPF